MIGHHTLTVTQHRLSQYYLSKLRAAEAMYQRGHEHSTDALTLFDQEWSQIKQWHDWSAEHSSDHDEIADLCMEYPQVGADLLLLRQHPRERLEWLDAGLVAARQLGDPRAEMVHLYLLGRTNTYLGRLDHALDFSEKALTLAQQLDNRLSICNILIVLGMIFYSQDDYERSRIANEQALAISEALGAKLEMGIVFNGLGNVALSQSDDERAYEYYARYLEISEAQGHSIGICMALRNLSMITRRLGDEPASKAFAERSVALCRAIGYRACLAEGLAELGILAFSKGSLTEALDYYQESLDLSRLISHHSNEAFVLHELVYVHFKLGDIPAALECLESAFSISQKIGDRWFSALALMTMAEVSRIMRDLPCACLKLREGLEIACTLQSSAIRAKYLLEAALIWRDNGHVEQAALWMGLVHENMSKLSVEQRRLYDQLRHDLEVELGPEQFSAALEHGKTLNLDSVIEGIMRELTLE